MNDFKSKILNDINSNKKNIIGDFTIKEEYLKSFSRMETINKKIADFKNSPNDFFENFDYNVYDKNYFSKNIDYKKLNCKIPENSNIITMINGCFSNENTKIISKNITVSSFIEKIKNKYFATEKHFLDYSEDNENQLTLLNSVLAKDGIYLHIHPNSIIEEPIYIVNVITEQDKNFFFNHRKLIILDENSSAKIIETDLFLSNYKALSLNVCLTKQAKNSNLDYLHINSDINSNRKNHSKVSLIVRNEFKLDEDAKLNYNTVIFDSPFGQNRTQFLLEGENAEVNTAMFSYLRNDSVVDIATLTSHLVPNTYSNQLVKTVADDNSYFSFDGKILVSQNAQKIKAAQNSHAILLSDSAQVNCQPQLEIYADDVECSHGTAIGNLEEEMMFYLNSRGIGKEEANKLLFMAFACDIIDKIPHKNMQDFIYSNLQEQIQSND